ncbi:uncharacterized protein LOC106167840 [Lingula anatina]|uniref:Uncharacterized protein LOC106167840 n=1 Tax=Lingula anatina TaxID=7574 RepID=A0A2R2MTF0_LINAN|nr:uncharacterized protein LOC106167840 [Lingula anatina]|eukprot:XP_023933393.1 uncharacterized protein LOC106167840 [Lingula anatina]
MKISKLSQPCAACLCTILIPVLLTSTYAWNLPPITNNGKFPRMRRKHVSSSSSSSASPSASSSTSTSPKSTSSLLQQVLPLQLRTSSIGNKLRLQQGARNNNLEVGWPPTISAKRRNRRRRRRRRPAKWHRARRHPPEEATEVYTGGSGTVYQRYFVNFFINVSLTEVYEILASVTVKDVRDFGRFGYSAVVEASESEVDNIRVSNSHSVNFTEQDAYAGANCETHVASSSYRWGLDRIDHPDIVTADDETLSINNNGTGVDVYVLDTGIAKNHMDFDDGSGVNRVISLCYDAWESVANCGGVNDSADDHGHGTHIAGLVGSLTWGVAKRVTLISVKVLDSNNTGTVNDVIGGIDWVKQQYAARGRPAVAIMALNTGIQVTLNNAVTSMYDEGIVPVVAAGNNGGDACFYSPASTPEAIVVGALTSTDTLTSFTNGGNCTGIYAPGEAIGSSYYRSPDLAQFLVMQGSSQAAAFVAGTVAVLIADNVGQNETGGDFVEAIKTALYDLSALGKITGYVPHNRLLQVPRDTC